MVRNVLSAITVAFTTLLAVPAFAQQPTQPEGTTCAFLPDAISSLSLGNLLVVINTLPTPRQQGTMLRNQDVRLEETIPPEHYDTIVKHNLPSWFFLSFDSSIALSQPDVLQGKPRAGLGVTTMYIAYAPRNSECMHIGPLVVDLNLAKDPTIAQVAASVALNRIIATGAQEIDPRKIAAVFENDRETNLDLIDTYLREQVQTVVMKKLGVKQ